MNLVLLKLFVLFGDALGANVVAANGPVDKSDVWVMVSKGAV